MARSVTIKSEVGTTSLTFSQFSRDADGTEHGVVSVTDAAFQGTVAFAFHPGESSLVEFFHSALDSPPVYRTDRYWDDRRRSLHFCLGRHDESRLGVTAYLHGNETHWRLEATLVLRPEEVARLVKNLSDFFGYDHVA